MVPASDVHRVLAPHLLLDGPPLVVDLDRSRGTTLVDARGGDEYLDFFGFFASNPVGFHHPRFHEARVEERLLQASRTRVSNADFATTLLAEFVATLSATAAPASHPHYFFVDGGALAVENAMKVAFDWKGRRLAAAGRRVPPLEVLHLEGAFHGRSGYTLSVTSTGPEKTLHFPLFDWPRIATPDARFGAHGELLPGIEEREAAALAAAREALARRDGSVAAILAEPIQGEGGDRHLRPGFLRGLRRLADEFDAMFILDEVQTGLGATGSWWAYQQLDVEPDIVCFAKKLQVGGILVNRRVDGVAGHVFETPGRISTTWGGSLTDMVRATEILRIIEEEALLEHAARRGAQLLAGVQGLTGRYPAILSNPRGRGLMVAVDLPGPAPRDRLLEHCAAERMLLIPAGQRGVRFRPALNVTASVIDDGLHRLGRALERL